MILAADTVCSLEGKKYEDGSQTKVDCNDWLVVSAIFFFFKGQDDDNSFLMENIVLN